MTHNGETSKYLQLLLFVAECNENSRDGSLFWDKDSRDEDSTSASKFSSRKPKQKLAELMQKESDSNLKMQTFKRHY